MTYKYMRKADAVNYWRNQIKPRVLMLRSANDMAALRESWNNYVDGLCKDGCITEYRADTWCQPKELR